MKNPVKDTPNKDNLLSRQEYRDLYAELEQKEMQVSSQEEWEEFEKEGKALLSRLPRKGFRVIRGGNWNSNPSNLRSAWRTYDTPANRILLIGFRIVRTK